MPDQTRIVSPGARPETVQTADGKVLTPPPDWSLLSGDVPTDAAGAEAQDQPGRFRKRGRKTFSQGISAHRKISVWPLKS